MSAVNFVRLLSLGIFLLIVPSHCTVPKDFDCPMRELAIQYATYIQPTIPLTKLQQIADALNGSPEAQNCNITLQTIQSLNLSDIPKHNKPPSWPDLQQQSDIDIYVDIHNGNDIINNGSIKYPFKSIQYALQYITTIPDNIALFKRLILRKGKYHIHETIHVSNLQHSNLLITNYNNELVEISGAVILNCSWTFWKNGTNANYYQCQLQNSNDLNLNSIPGLRINNSRCVRARFPNANPETDGFGSTLRALSWLPPTLPKLPNEIFYPLQPFRNNSIPNYYQRYNIGMGGNCLNFVPPASLFCSNAEPNVGAMYTIPSGLTYNAKILPHGVPYYSNVSGGIIHVWRPNHWSTWQFAVNETGVSNQSTYLKWNRGGFQGARGDNVGEDFYVENIFEELDWPTEYFYNQSEQILYYYHNDSDNDINDFVFEATKLKILFNFTNVTNVVTRGLTFSDSMYDYMDNHAVPSGGDWSLSRQSAIYIQNSSNMIVEGNVLDKLDGNGISMNGYCRNITIYNNEIKWIGGTAIYNWGDTEGITFEDSTISMGYDGYSKQRQPQFINISYNYVHEIGIWSKQSSFYFQAKSFNNYIGHNIAFNGPRALINFNDGMGGGSVVEKNLLFNSCRETGDHGPINSWDRLPYLTTNNDQNEVTWLKKKDYIFQNFIIANYQSQEAIDNDDGSYFYEAYNNFLVYGQRGLKSGNGGNSNYHHSNIYAYITNLCFLVGEYNVGQLPGWIDHFYNNTCVMNVANPENYGVFLCNDKQNAWPMLGNNSIHTITGNKSFTGLCNANEQEFQNKYEWDLGTTISTLPNSTLLIQQAYSLLWNN